MTHQLQGWAVEGGPQAQDTLAKMRKMVRDDARNRKVIEAARRIVLSADVRNYVAQARLLRAWLKDHLRFVRDPNGVELLQRPGALLEEIERTSFTMGDCDDAATLGAALATAVGFPVRMEAVAFYSPNAPFQHVYSVIETPSGDVDLDTTRPDNMPIPPVVSRKITVRI